MLPVNVHQPPTRLSGASARPLLALFALLAVGMSCGAPSVLKTAPAGELQLAIQLDNALVAGEAPVPMTVQVSDPSDSGGVVLSGSQRLTCDGVSDPVEANRPWNLARFLVPRQLPGGAYTCVYTDERGQQTTATIPVPLAPLAFTAPTAGAHVPIPLPREPHPVATPPANGLCPFNTQLDQPLVIHYTYPVPPGYTPPLPSQVVSPPSWDNNDYSVQQPYASVTAQASYGFFQPPPADWAVRGEECGLGQAATGTYALPFVIASSSGQLEQLVPAPGYVTLNLVMQWLPPTGGFHAILVDSQDSVTIPITWTTPQSGSAESNLTYATAAAALGRDGDSLPPPYPQQTRRSP